MFNPSLQFHAFPEVEGFTRYDVDIVSAEMPSGASWLANCLLELGTPAWKPWGADLRQDWQSLGALRFRYQRRDEAWRRLLPSLCDGREFDFLPAPVPRYTHNWPGAYATVAKTIFFVRDPRDALFSLWQRFRRLDPALADESFADCMRKPWFHYPLSRLDYFCIWLRVWRLALAKRDHLIIRYEDYRRAALPTLRRAVNFLGIAASEEALRSAVAASDYSVARDAEQRLIKAGVIHEVFNRAGCADEWRHSFDASMHAVVGPRFASVYQWLAYSADQSGLTHDASCTDIPGWPDSMLLAIQANQWPEAAQARLRQWLIDASNDCSP